MKKMKCGFCDCNVKKGEEFCPQCGNRITEGNKSDDKAEVFGKVLRFYDYKDGLAFYSFLFVLFGLFLIAASSYIVWDYEFYGSGLSSFNVRVLVFSVVGILFIIYGIFSYFRLKSCSVTLAENGIYGYIPTNPVIPFRTVYFEVLYENIESVKRSGFGTTRHSQPKMVLKASDDKFTISFPKKENTVDLSECFYRMLDM